MVLIVAHVFFCFSRRQQIRTLPRTGTKRAKDRKSASTQNGKRKPLFMSEVGEVQDGRVLAANRPSETDQTLLSSLLLAAVGPSLLLSEPGAAPEMVMLLC